MAARIIIEIITTGYQINNKTDYLNALGLSTALGDEEAQLFETYKNQNKLFKHTIEFNTNKITVSRWMDSEESLRELQNELLNLYKSWDFDFRVKTKAMGWNHQLSVDLDATIPQ